MLTADGLLLRIVCVAAAGGLGAVSRWGITRLSQVYLSQNWPLGTLAVNVLGCLLFGAFYERMRIHELPPESLLRLVVLTGFLGALTTFSTFAFDTYQLALAQGGSPSKALLAAAANVLANLVLGLAALVIGFSLARAMD